jgi:hypothetical protein
MIIKEQTDKLDIHRIQVIYKRCINFVDNTMTNKSVIIVLNVFKIYVLNVLYMDLIKVTM